MTNYDWGNQKTLDLYHQALRPYAPKTKHYKKEVKTVLDTMSEIQDWPLATYPYGVYVSFLKYLHRSLPNISKCNSPPKIA